MVISNFRGVGTSELVDTADLPIKAKNQASLNFLIPEINLSKESGGIELSVQYIGF